MGFEPNTVQKLHVTINNLLKSVELVILERRKLV